MKCIELKKVEVKVEYSDGNLSAYIEGAPIVVVGKGLTDIKKKVDEAISLYIESCAELCITPASILTGELQLTYKGDIAENPRWCATAHPKT